MYDVIIVGGGPAGLSAALVLGRCRRRVLVIEAGRPRNACAEHMHGYLTRDGTEPVEMQRLGRQEVLRYGVEIREAEAVGGSCGGGGGAGGGGGSGGFEIECDDGSRARSRKLLLATGVADVLPQIEGLKELYGRSVHHCPYCDGWEHKDQPLAAYGRGEQGAGLALALRTWTGRVTACTDGEPLDREWLEKLAARGVALRDEKVAKLEGEGGRLRRVHFQRGPALECEGLFFNTGQYQRSELAQRLECAIGGKGEVKTTDRQRTNIPGLWLAGDADRDVQFVIVAAAEGATAAVSINKELQEEDSMP
ncbi:MAG: NAD(P)/FAD-dependent oxidoreductase [Phycisphaerales bacterium]